MAVHQGGKVCLLSQYDAEQLEKYGIVPSCVEHRHLRKAAAEELASDRSLKRIKVPGPDRYVWIQVQHWERVRGVLQLVAGDIQGCKRRANYEIPAVGAHERRQNVRAINAEVGGGENEPSRNA